MRYGEHKTIKCQHCNKDIARVHNTTKRTIVPVKGSVIVKSELTGNTVYSRSFYESSYVRLEFKNRIKCGQKNCGKHTTFITTVDVDK